MATFFQTAEGNIGMRRSDDEKTRLGLPSGATLVRDFDETTNAGVLADFTNSPETYSVVAGVLRKNGLAVNFAADSTSRAERKALREGIAQAIADLDAFLSLSNPSNALILAHIKELSRNQKRMIRILDSLI